MRYLLVLLLLISCGKPTQTTIRQLTTVENSDKFTGVFNIGGQSVKLYRDETGLVDVITSYVYTPNPDNTDGEFYIYGVNLLIINNMIRWEYSITSIQQPTRLYNVINDDGTSLAAVTHLLTVEITHIDNFKLKVILRDNTGKTVVSRSLEEEWNHVT